MRLACLGNHGGLQSSLRALNMLRYNGFCFQEFLLGPVYIKTLIYARFVLVVEFWPNISGSRSCTWSSLAYIPTRSLRGILICALTAWDCTHGGHFLSLCFRTLRDYNNRLLAATHVLYDQLDGLEVEPSTTLGPLHDPTSVHTSHVHQTTSNPCSCGVKLSGGRPTLSPERLGDTRVQFEHDNYISHLPILAVSLWSLRSLSDPFNLCC